MKRYVYQTDHVFWTVKRANQTIISTCRLDEEKEKKEIKSEN
jgi:hypothetical protein